MIGASADCIRLSASSSTSGKSGCFVIEFELVEEVAGSDPRRRTALRGDVRFESRPPELGLLPVLVLLLFVVTELRLEVDGVGLVPILSERGDDLTLRHRFLAPFVTKSPKSGTSFLDLSLDIYGDMFNSPILLFMLPLVFLPLCIVHIDLLNSTWLSSPLSRIRINIIRRTTQQVLPSGYTKSNTIPSLQFRRNDR